MGRRDRTRRARQQRDGRGISLGAIAVVAIGGGLGIVLGAALLAGGKHLPGLGRSQRFLSVTAAWSRLSEYCDVGLGWVFPVTMSKLPYPSASVQKPAGFEAWAARNHGLPASGNSVAVTLQGLDHHTVVVQDLRVVVVHRAAPPTTATYPNPAYGCGGGLAPNYFRVNLDEDPTVVHAFAGFTPGVGRVPPVPLPHQVSESRPEVWYLKVVTAECACSWYGYIDWTSEGVSRTAKISDHGRPFETVTPTNATMLRPVAFGVRAWTLAPPSTPAKIKRAVLAGEQPNPVTELDAAER